MLVNFRFENCRSFYNETNFSMEAIKDNELKDLNTFTVNRKLMPKGENELLKSAVIFGANASGKSNVLKALNYMRAVIQYSASQAPVVRDNEYYAFYDKAFEEPSLYEIEIIQNNTYYKYGFELLNGRVIHEWLYRRNERLTPVFKRNEGEIEIAGLPKQVSRLINVAPNTLFLSVGNNFNLDIGPYLNDVVVWFQNLIIVFEQDANTLEIYSLENGKYRDRALKILELADIGIKKMEVKKDKVGNINDINDIIRFNVQRQNNQLRGQLKQENTDMYNIDLETTFDIYNKNKKVVGKLPVRLYQHAGFNSEGTARLLCYLGWILAALDQGRVIFIEEVDSRLHFLVSDFIIKLFNSIDKNPNNAQLICTAHNVMLMDENLRRDQIYFTSKNQYGESNLVALSDFNNVRKNDLFSKKYLAGFYADLPDMLERD